MTNTNQETQPTLPILYSFRRCPYAIRARMTLKYSGVSVHLREVVLRNKPQTLLQYSSKGTVPVLVLSDGRVIDESRDVMTWALAIDDPEQWLPEQNTEQYAVINSLIDNNDSIFKGYLDKYKYADRYPEQPEVYYRSQGEQFLMLLEARLKTQQYLLNDKVSMADIAIFPFIRQFANVDTDWFYQSRYRELQKWLDHFLQSAMFIEVMEKYPPWTEGAVPQLFSRCG